MTCFGQWLSVWASMSLCATWPFLLFATLTVEVLGKESPSSVLLSEDSMEQTSQLSCERQVAWDRNKPLWSWAIDTCELFLVAVNCFSLSWLPQMGLLGDGVHRALDIATLPCGVIVSVSTIPYGLSFQRENAGLCLGCSLTHSAVVIVGF